MGSSSSRDINLAIVGEDLTRKSTDSAARNYDRLQHKVDSFSTTKAQKETEEFSRLIGSKLKDGENAITSVTRATDELTTKVSGLRREFARTGDLKLFEQIKQGEADLRRYEQTLDSMGRSAKADFGEAQSGLESLTAAGPQLLAAAAPLLAPVAAGSLLAVLGAGGLGIGIAGQFDSPEVKAALTRFKSDAGAALHDVTVPFRAEMANSIEILDLGVDRFLRGLQPGLRALAPELSKISTDVAEGLEKAGPELSSAFVKLTPVLDEVGTDLETLTDDAAKFFDEVAGGAKGDAKALHEVVGQIGDLIQIAGVGLGAVGKIFDVLATGQQKVDDFVKKQGGVGGDLLRVLEIAVESRINPIKAVTDSWSLLQHVFGTDRTAVFGLKQTADAATTATTDLAALNTELSATKTTADTLAGGLTDKVLNSLVAGDSATLRWHESLTGLASALKKNKDRLNINTAAGQEDREAVLASVQANIQQYDALIATGASADDAASAYDKNTAALERQLRKAHLGKDAIKSLIGQYEKVPDTVDTVVSITGLTKAIDDLDDTLRLINNLEGRDVEITVRSKVVGRIGPGGDAAEFSPESGWAPLYGDPGSSSRMVTEPARDVSITSTLVLDGQVIDRRFHRINSQYRHAQRVGTR